MGGEPNNPARHDQEPLQQPVLSVEEQAVFHWILQGKRDGEIATLTNTKPRTTEKRTGRILAKYNTETRAGAVSAYYEIELARLRHENERLTTENAKMRSALAKIRRALGLD